MLSVVLLIAACTPSPITVGEARRLVLETPSAVRSRTERGAKLAAALEDRAQGKWVFRVYASNDTTSASNLIGWYAVDPNSADVTDWVLDYVPVVGPRLSGMQDRLRKAHCYASAGTP